MTFTASTSRHSVLSAVLSAGLSAVLSAVLPAGLAGLALAPGCVDADDPDVASVEPDSRRHGGSASGATYVLVHGAFQDASSWDFVKPLLKLGGHRVVTVDLPGRDGDPTPAGAISLADYVDAVASAVEAQPEPVILVGHSFGGITISQVAEIMPERIARLVYVAASLPADGGSLLSQSQEDHWNGFTDANFIISPDFTQASVAEPDRVSIFCGDCGPVVRHVLLGDFHDEPLGPMAEPVALTPERFGVTSKVYIKTLRDNAVSATMQDLMLSRTPVDQVFALDTSHSVFYTRPLALALILASLD